MLALFLGICGVLFGMIISTMIQLFTKGYVTIDHLSQAESVVEQAVAFGTAAVFIIGGAAFAWKARLSTVRTTTTIIGVVVTSVVAVHTLIIWLLMRLSGLLP